MNNLTLEEILFIHHRILIEHYPTSNEFGILDLEKLESIVNKIQKTARKKDSFEETLIITVEITFSVITGHIFQTGNKLLGIVLGILFMLINGFETDAFDDDIYEVTTMTSQGKWKYKELKSWFEEHFY
jgi:death-on-curing family protein